MADGSKMLKNLSGELKDLVSAFDKLTERMDGTDLSKMINAPGATSELVELKEALSSMYGVQGQVLDRIERTLNRNERLKKQYEEQLEYLEKGEEGYDDLTEAIEKLQKQEDKLREAKLEEIKNNKYSNKLLSEQGLKTKLMTVTKLALGRAFGVVTKLVQAYVIVLGKLEQVHERVFEWQGQLQKSLSGLALRFGTTTDSVIAMRDEGLKQLLDPQGLGGLGMSLDEIVGKMGDFNEQLGFTRRISQETAAQLIKMGMGVGLSASETGQLARTFTLAGQSMEDAQGFMKLISSTAAAAGVNSARLAKQFTGAGRALFMLSGPKARAELIKTAGKLEQMGIGLDKLAGFTDMSDTFDQAAESMAKLNTVFGTHINAMEVFAEQDPAKRFEMVSKQIRQQGWDLNNLSRMQKKFMAESMGVDAETIDAMITESKLTKEQRAEREQMSKLAEKQAQAQEAYEKSLMRSKQVLVAEQMITANINDMLTKQMAPFYDAFAEGGGLVKGAGMFDSYAKKWVATVNKIGSKMGQQGLGGMLSGIGKTFGQIWDKVMNFISSDSVASFLTGLVGAFGVISDVIGVIVTVIGPPIKALLWLIGKALQVITAAWKFLKWVSFSSPGDAEGQKRGEEEYYQAIGGVLGEADTVAPQSSGAMVTSPAIAGARASGGPVQKGQYYMVGEQGPELFHAPAAGTIIPSAPTQAALAAGGGDATINVQVVLDGEIIQERTYRKNLRSIA